MLDRLVRANSLNALPISWCASHPSPYEWSHAFSLRSPPWLTSFRIGPSRYTQTGFSQLGLASLRRPYQFGRPLSLDLSTRGIIVVSNLPLGSDRNRVSPGRSFDHLDYFVTGSLRRLDSGASIVTNDNRLWNAS